MCASCPSSPSSSPSGATECPSDEVRMAASDHFGTQLTRIVAPPEPHRRCQWQGSHGGLWLFRHTPHDDRGPVGGGGIECPSGRVRTAAQPYFGT
eukprot:523580-Pyramimonas_sp.AAC.1